MESYKHPVSEEGEFVGREKEIDEIKNNFLKETKDYYHYVISGMGNYGKTSFMRYLYFTLFGKDEKFIQKFDTALIEFNSFMEEFKQKSDFKETFNEQIKPLIKADAKEKILLIDDYDKMLNKFPDDFINSISSLDEKRIFLILAGQKDISLLEREYANRFPLYTRYTHSITLGGMDDSIYTLKKDNDNKSINSIQLIDFLRSKIGLKTDCLNDDVKSEIVTYSSGIPYFIKRILYELLSEWLDNYAMHPLKIDDVENAVSKIIEPSKEYTIKRACWFDEEPYGTINVVPNSVVLIRDIVNAIAAVGKGKARRGEIMKKVIPLPYPNREIERARIASFNEKLNKLATMGFVAQDNEYLVGIPHMFFYKGENIIYD